MTHVDSAVSLVQANGAFPVARFLRLHDLPQLLQLESEKWDVQQAAAEDELACRIESYPGLCVGAFCPTSGRMFSSLFMKPAVPDFWKHARDWRDCTRGATPLQTSALFGVSLSSRAAAGVDAIFRFFWPHALAGGWRHIYVGSPIPGWREWHRRHPGRGIVEYVARRRDDGLPCDPQLRYYHGRGFTEVVCIKRDYFPHEASEDHAVILRGVVPLSRLSLLWRAMPGRQTQRITHRLAAAVL